MAELLGAAQAREPGQLLLVLIMLRDGAFVGGALERNSSAAALGATVERLLNVT